MGRIHKKQYSTHIIGGQFAGGNLYLVQADGVSVVVSPGQAQPTNTYAMNQVSVAQNTDYITGGTFNGATLTLTYKSGEEVSINGNSPVLVQPGMIGQSIFSEQNCDSIVGGSIDGNTITLYKLCGDTVVINGYSNVPSYPNSPGFVVTTTTTTTAAPTTTTTTTAAPTTTTTTTAAPTTTTTTTAAGGYDPSLPQAWVRNIIYDENGVSTVLVNQSFSFVENAVQSIYPLYDTTYLTYGTTAPRYSGNLGLGSVIYQWDGTPWPEFWGIIYESPFTIWSGFSGNRVVYYIITDVNGMITTFEPIALPEPTTTTTTTAPSVYNTTYYAIDNISSVGPLSDSGVLGLHDNLEELVSHIGLSMPAGTSWGSQGYSLSTPTLQVGAALYDTGANLWVDYNYSQAADLSVPRYMTLLTNAGEYRDNNYQLYLGSTIAKIEWDGSYARITELIDITAYDFSYCNSSVLNNVSGGSGPGGLNLTMVTRAVLKLNAQLAYEFDTQLFRRTRACTIEYLQERYTGGYEYPVGSTNWGDWSSNTAIYTTNTGWNAIPSIGDVIYRDSTGSSYFGEGGFLYQDTSYQMHLDSRAFNWVTVGANGVVTNVEQLVF